MAVIVGRCKSLAVIFAEMHGKETKIISNVLTDVNDIFALVGVDICDIDNGTSLDTNAGMAFGRIDDYSVSVSGEFRLIPEGRGLCGLRLLVRYFDCQRVTVEIDFRTPPHYLPCVGGKTRWRVVTERQFFFEGEVVGAIRSERARRKR